MPGLPHPFFGAPPAYMGFVGFVRFRGSTVTAENVSAFSYQNTVLRATTADINLSQEVTRPDVIDSRYDRTLYQLGPQLVDGTIAFPATYDIQGTTPIVEAIYRLAASRTPSDGLLNNFDMDIKYAENIDPNEAGFVYQGCVVNTWQFSVTQGDVINLSVDIVGVTRDLATQTDISPPNESAIQNVRIVTWNDARVELVEGSRGGFGTISGEFVRSFEANINNNVDRFYTLNGQLFPQAIAPTKRDVNGSVVLMGRHKDLGGLARTNEDFCNEDSQIKFGFGSTVSTAIPGRSCASSFGVTIPNVVFEIETMALTNDIFESTVNWHALLAAGTGVPGSTGDPLLTSLGTTTFSF